MTPVWLYYLFAFVLFAMNGLAWCTTVLALPGNWAIVAFTALFAWLVPVDDGRGISWYVVFVVAGLAVFGEVLEIVASAAGASKHGASRRAAVLSIVGATAGSLLGVMIGIPILIVGPLIAAVGGGALGAFVGAYLGEKWKGRTHVDRIAVGKGALMGRLWGTVGKLAVGAIMVVVVTWDSFS